MEQEKGQIRLKVDMSDEPPNVSLYTTVSADCVKEVLKNIPTVSKEKLYD